VQLVRDLDRVAEVLTPELRDGDMVITLGAGNVSTVGPRLLAALEVARA
jgi:UDP-N-acetylmuramate--alanine ligase